jgi:hypothetical protein
MILEWLTQLPVLAVTVLVVFAPGAAAMWFAGLRGLALAASAPMFTIASSAAVALLFGMTGLRWTAATWAVAMIAAVAVSFLLGRWAGGRLEETGSQSARWLLPVAVSIGVALSAWRIIAYIQDPAGISQTNDAVFHMNAVRYILETSDASSLHVNSVIGGHSFYPSAWHGIVSLVVLLTGAEVPVAANMLTVIIGGLIWTVGIAWLARTVTGSNTVGAYAAVLSGALQTFPLLMFQWGVLFPNALSTAVIPAAIATVITLGRWIRVSDRRAHVVRGALLVLIAVAAIVLAQPAGVLPWAAISAVWLSSRLFERRAESGLWRVAVALVVMWAALVAVWLYLATSTSGSHWPPYRGKLEVFLDVLLNGQVLIPFAYAVSVLMLLGLYICVRTAGLRWFAVAWAGISGLYLLDAAVGAPIIREWILGAWYADPYRISALAPIMVIPLAAMGVDAVVRAVAARTRREPDSSPVAVAGLAGSVVLMIVLILVRPVTMPAVTQGTFDRESRYLADSDSYLSPDERLLLESLDEHVPDDARVLGNPSTGSGFGYFLSGLDVYPRTWAAPQSAAWDVLAAGLRDAASDPAVCEALELYGDPQYVLDFGPGERGPGRYLMPGMTDFAGRTGFELVESVGDASLWRITACAQ